MPDGGGGQIDWKHPDYRAEYERRSQALQRLANGIQSNPNFLHGVKQYYSEHPWDYVKDWGMTFDPRLIERGLTASMPFILWPRQEDFLKWIYARWKAGERGMVEKSRDCDALCRFHC